MKNIQTILKEAYLIVMVCTLGSTIGHAQPVIKVPQACEVVYAGTGLGASTGFGGAVGDGGIVAMPDPFDYPEDEGNFYYSSNDSELITWELFGDLSMQTDTDYNEVVQLAGAVNPVNLQSYNKNLRFAEMPSGLQPNFYPRWARSKGRVIVSYYDKRCVGKIKFDVFKRYKNDKEKNFVPMILGPECVLPNTIYTFSVDPTASDNANDEIGFDKYYWSGLPEDITMLFNAADNSSITFITGDSVLSFTLRCCYGRANAWDGDATSSTHTTCVTKQVDRPATAPAFVTAPPTCHPTGSTSFSVVYPNIPVSAPPTTYSWTAPNTGWNTSTSVGASNTTLTVNTDGNLNSGTLTLTINSGCDPAVINYQINRSITAPFTVIPTGATTTCLNSTSWGNTYTLSPNPGGNNIEWVTIPGTNPANPPAAVTGVFLVNANTATVTVNTTSESGNFLLVARSSVAACNTTFVYTQINIRPAAPTVVAGTVPPTCVPISSAGLTTFSVTSPDATSYTWTLPAGWSNVGTPSQQTSGNPTLVPPVNNSTVGAPALPAGTISVIANSATGCSSIATNFTVNYIRITTNVLVTGAGNCDQYSINTNVAPCSGTITNWTVGGTTAVNSPTVNIFGNTLTLCGSTAPAAGTICANVVINGVTYTTCSSTVATGTHGLKQATPKVILEGVIISPNPNDGNFSILIDVFEKSAKATITDFNGNVISKYTLIKGENKIQNDQLVQGTYFVILSVDGKQETRQLIVK